MTQPLYVGEAHDWLPAKSVSNMSAPPLKLATTADFGVTASEANGNMTTLTV